MRLWSLHPRYLDRMGLTACWREGLLARKVLEGNTKGYTNHLQLIRFRQTDDPLAFIDRYLHTLCDEAESRGYNFDRDKLGACRDTGRIKVTLGQIGYEYRHLLDKLKARDRCRYEQIAGLDPGSIFAHPLFEIKEGEIEKWEILK